MKLHLLKQHLRNSPVPYSTLPGIRVLHIRRRYAKHRMHLEVGEKSTHNIITFVALNHAQQMRPGSVCQRLPAIVVRTERGNLRRKEKLSMISYLRAHECQLFTLNLSMLCTSSIISISNPLLQLSLTNGSEMRAQNLNVHSLRSSGIFDSCSAIMDLFSCSNMPLVQVSNRIGAREPNQSEITLYDSHNHK